MDIVNHLQYKNCIISLFKAYSRHFRRSDSVNGVRQDRTKEWSRPCFKGFEKVVIGDSSVRVFAKIGRRVKGMTISAFGGMDILEMVCLLQSGKLSTDWDLNKLQIRNRFQAGRDEFPTVRFCKHCYSECMTEFKGQLIIVIGLNNILKAETLPFATLAGVNQQNIFAMNKMLDETCKKMAPEANIKFAPVLKIEKHAGRNSRMTQNAINEMERSQVKLRLLEMDPDEPRRKGLYEGDGTHMKNVEGADFWTEIFTKDME